MADVFLSYKSSDRPRAETLKRWFEDAGWSVWIDRGIEVGEEWEPRIESELGAARVVVVIWSAEARRSIWVTREAHAGLAAGKLVQIHATGLPLLAPFESIQAIRMQSWSGEEQHTERRRLLVAVAERLGCDPPPAGIETESTAGMVRLDAVQLVETVLSYCAAQLAVRRTLREGGAPEDLFQDVRAAFDAMLESIGTAGSGGGDDREGILHFMLDGFMEQLERLAPLPGALQ